MLYEYAVEPQAIGSSWGTFRYVFEKFGFDKGRLISEYPKRWLREVYDASLGLPPVEKKRIEEALSQARKNKLVRYGRNYDPAIGDWLRNALTEHHRLPFHAIIASSNPGSDDFIIKVEDLDETQGIFAVPHDCEVERNVASLSSAMEPLLSSAKRIVFVDAYYSPFNTKYQSVLRACLNIVHTAGREALCEVHYLDHKNAPSIDSIESNANTKFRGIIPDGMKLSIYQWREKQDGADFHARYLLTDKGGIRIDAGFSAEGNHQTTDIALMDFELSQAKLRAFAREADVYELVGPVLEIASDGSAKRL